MFADSGRSYVNSFFFFWCDDRYMHELVGSLGFNDLICLDREIPYIVTAILLLLLLLFVIVMFPAFYPLEPGSNYGS